MVICLSRTTGSSVGRSTQDEAYGRVIQTKLLALSVGKGERVKLPRLPDKANSRVIQTKLLASSAAKSERLHLLCCLLKAILFAESGWGFCLLKAFVC